MLSVRPRITELVFQLYGRSLHPELFEVQCGRQIERGGYLAHVQITNAGHVITWQYDGITLTGGAAAANHPLPERRRLMSHKVKGTCKDQLECRGGVTYHVEFSLEPVERETFWTYQKELTEAGTRDGLEWLEAKPRDPDAGFERIRMGFSATGLEAMELKDNFGQTTRLRFMNLQRNPKVDPAEFRFEPPKGADILGER